jgi:hypothetical protein
LGDFPLTKCNLVRQNEFLVRQNAIKSKTKNVHLYKHNKITFRPLGLTTKKIVSTFLKKKKKKKKKKFKTSDIKSDTFGHF